MNRRPNPDKLVEKILRLGPPPVRDGTGHKSFTESAASPGLGGLERMKLAARAESDAEALATLQNHVIEKALNGDVGNLSGRERTALEAIVEREYRPVSYILNGTFEELPHPWQDYNAGDIRRRIDEVIPSVGRVELISPAGNSTIHLGTGFIVGERLMMTNRHVAELFVNGVGSLPGTLILAPGRKGALNFGREKDFDTWDVASSIRVTGVKMIHPYWDMALLELNNVPSAVKPLTLSTIDPEDLKHRRIVVIGYPGRGKDLNPEAIRLEEELFGGIYGVKRLAPGEIDGTDDVESYRKMVEAIIHDSTTLAGNSGSCVLDVTTGEVVGLHFMGATFTANYSVPIHALASDPRVVDMGVNFSKPLPVASQLWDSWWARADGGESLSPPRSVVIPVPRRLAAAVPDLHVPKDSGWINSSGSVNGEASVTIPLTICLSVDSQGLSAITAAGKFPLESAQVPAMYDGMDERIGYDPAFLGQDANLLVPLPEITEEGRNILALQKDGQGELKYHHFSIFMHSGRRLALFTAANVDWRKERRLVNGRKPTRAELTEIPNGVHEQWVMDDRISAEHQLPDVFFTKDRGAFDKGHLVRRDDVTWGDSFEDIQMANGDTYYTTNCSPQTAIFNQASRGQFNWGDLESMVEKETKAEKVMIFSGPVYSKNDRIFFGRGDNGPVKVKIPRRFWKIIVANTPSGLKAFGFIPRQDLSSVDFGLEFVLPEEWRQHLVSIATIEEALGGLVTLDWFKQRDASL